MLVEASIFLERAEKLEDGEENGCFLSLRLATVLLSCLGADMLPSTAQLSVRCSGGQPVTATSKRRHAGSILSSGAQFVEIQG